MKALTLTQPWATLVASGAKRFETRSWSTCYTGPLAIHAAKGFPSWARETVEEEPFRTALAQHGFSCASELPTGVIVAVAILRRCIYIEADVTKGGLWEVDVWERISEEHEFGDYTPGRYAWELGGAVRVEPPIACRGALSVWDVPEDVATRLSCITIKQESKL